MSFKGEFMRSMTSIRITTEELFALMWKRYDRIKRASFDMLAFEVIRDLYGDVDAEAVIMRARVNSLEKVVGKEWRRPRRQTTMRKLWRRLS